MSISREHEMYLERQQRDRDYELREEQREKDEAFHALEMAFEERAGCVEACFDTCIHTAACSGIAEPIAMAVDGWLKSQRIARRAA